MESRTRKFVNIAIFSTLSFLIMFLEINLPLFPFFLKIDFSDLPALILAMVYGPLTGIMVELGKNLLHLTVSTNFGIGELANFLVGGTFAGLFGYLYHTYHVSKIKSLFWASIFMVLMAVAVNVFIIIPLYSSVLRLPLQKIVTITSKINPLVTNLTTYLLLVIIPFNAIKAAMVSFLTWLLSFKLESYLISKQGGQ